MSEQIDIEWDMRDKGPIVDANWNLPARRGTLHVAKPLWRNISDQDRRKVILAATCHLVVEAHHFEPMQGRRQMLDLCGYHRPAPNLDWQQLAADYAQVISQTCGMLDVASLAGATDLKWNGRYTKRAADAVWDSDTQHGHIRLAKKLWPLLITDEQQEVLVHATCLLIHAARPDLAKAPDRGEYYVGAEGPLLAQCGYRRIRGPSGPPDIVFPPMRVHLHCQI
jgi:hypothetical protein